MKERIKKFFRKHEAQVYHTFATVAAATGVGVVLGRKIVNDNKPVMVQSCAEVKDGPTVGYIVTLKNGHEMPFFKDIPPAS